MKTLNLREANSADKFEAAARTSKLGLTTGEAEVGPKGGAYVRWVQQMLNQVLGLRLKVDGITGPQTRSAIRNFQSREGLKVDGIAGPKTAAALRAASAKPVAAPPSSPRVFSSAPVPGTFTSPCLPRTLLPCQQQTIIDHFVQGKDFVERSRQAGYLAAINALAACIGAGLRAATPIGYVRVSGHASSEGSARRNLELGEARAHKVATDLGAALNAQGVTVVIGTAPATSGVIVITPETRGATIPVADNGSAEGRRRNRRTEILLNDLYRQPAGPASAPPEIGRLMQMVGRVLGSLPLGTTGIVLPTRARFLDPAEQAEAMTVFRGSLDFTKIVITNGLGYNGRRFTVAVRLSSGWHVALNMGNVGCWASRPRSETLVHELVHAWQSQHHGSDPRAFMTNSLACQALAEAQTVMRGGRYSAYAYIPGKPFGEYAAEQVAQQVEHRYARRGHPTPAVITTIQSVGANMASADNASSLKVISAHKLGAPGVVSP